MLGPAASLALHSPGRKDLGLNPPQLDGTVSLMANGTGIPLIQRIQVSHEDSTVVKIGDQGGNLAPTNVSVTDDVVGKTTKDSEGIQLALRCDKSPANIEDTTRPASLEDPAEPSRHEPNFLCSQNSSSNHPASASDKLDSPINDQRPVPLSQFSFQGGMASPLSSRPPPTRHTEEQVVDGPLILPTLTSRLRETLHPLVIQNVQLRREHALDKILPEKVQNAKNLLTDELCESFIGKMQSVRQELQALKTDGPLNQFPELAYSIGRVNGHVNDMDSTNYSTDVSNSAPEAIASTSQRVTQPEDDKVPASYLPTPPVSGSLLNASKGPRAMLYREKGWRTTSAVAPMTRRSMSPPHPPLPEGKDRAYGIGPDFFSTPSSRVREGKRQSVSPGPSRHSGPRRTSRIHSPSDRRSPSPRSHRHSPLSYRRLSPTPDHRSPFRHCRSLSPHPHNSPSSPHPYDTCLSEVSRSLDQSHSHRSPFPSPRLNGNRQHVRDRSRSRSYSSRHSADQDLPAKSYLNNNLDARSKATNSSKDYPNQEDKMNAVQSTISTQGLVKPCHNVPGLWFVKTGHNDASITKCEFEVDRETAMKWDLFEKHPQSSQTVASHFPKVCLQLLCLPGDLVRSVYETSNLGSATPEDVAIAFSNIKSEWPIQGTLIVEVNSNMSCGKTWLPRHLTQTHPPLDLTGCIREGINVVRLIQLTGLADKVFVLHAMPSSVESSDSAMANSEWEIIDWAEHVQHSSLNMKPAVVEVT